MGEREAFEKVANQIAKDYLACRKFDLRAMIYGALVAATKAERERCAELFETIENDHNCANHGHYSCSCIEDIGPKFIAAIRESE